MCVQLNKKITTFEIQTFIYFVMRIGKKNRIRKAICKNKIKAT